MPLIHLATLFASSTLAIAVPTPACYDANATVCGNVSYVAFPETSLLDGATCCGFSKDPNTYHIEKDCVCILFT